MRPAHLAQLRRKLGVELTAAIEASTGFAEDVARAHGVPVTDVLAVWQACDALGCNFPLRSRAVGMDG